MAADIGSAGGLDMEKAASSVSVKSFGTTAWYFSLATWKALTKTGGGRCERLCSCGVVANHHSLDHRSKGAMVMWKAGSCPLGSRSQARSREVPGV